MGAKRRELRRRNVGSRLREAREAKGRPLREVEQAIKVHAHHLEALEAGDYENLPDPAWARGFLVTYANYLGLDDEHLADGLFRRRRLYRPRRFLKRHWRVIIAVLGVIVVAAMIIAAFVVPYGPFANWLGGILEAIDPGRFI